MVGVGGRAAGPRPRFAVIPTNGRPCLKDCYEAIQAQVDASILVYTSPYTEKELRPPPGHGVAIRDLRKPPNISRWWNQGLDICKAIVDVNEFDPIYDVAILNDDVIVPSGWFDAVSEGMREEGCVAACSGGPYANRIIHKQPHAVALNTRLQGFAFILAGEKGIRANEHLHWYFSDDFVDWTARQQGGMVMVPGLQVNHLYPNGQMTGELQELCAQDAATFHAMWGRMPW